MCRYDKAEEDAESDVDDAEEVDEFEFSDDESEATWRREQRAAEPAKRKMAQPGSAPAMRSGAYAAFPNHLVQSSSPLVEGRLSSEQQVS